MSDRYRNLYAGLAALLRSGIVLERAVHSLRQNGTIKEPMGSALAGSVASGSPLSIALAECAPGVTPEELALVEAGEATGRLEETLDKVAEIRENRAEQRRRFFVAARYPIALFHAAALLMPIARLGFKGELFGNFGAVVIWWIIVLGPVYGLALLVIVMRQTPQGRERIRKIIEKLPGFGNAATTQRRAYFSTVLCAAYDSAVPIERSVELAGRAAGVDVRTAVEGVGAGRSLADALTPVGIYTADAISRIATAETAGELSDTLEHLAAEDFHFAKEILASSCQFVAWGLYGLMALWIATFVISAIASYYGMVNDLMD
ncbi:MAG: type II secretion system F family protein [Planctomycetota bacterium]|nr:type II secretion system F family protein [Planctomycetota bacterium]